MKIRFIGARECVTVCKHLVITQTGRHLLLDCGLYQGHGKDTNTMNRDLGLMQRSWKRLFYRMGMLITVGTYPACKKTVLQWMKRRDALIILRWYPFFFEMTY